MKTIPTFSQADGHENTAAIPSNSLVPTPLDPTDVSLTSKSLKSVPASEKLPDTTHKGYSYAISLTAADIAYIKTGSALRSRYRVEANSHRNMKQRAKEQGKIVSPAISEFRDFLLLIGPMPQPGMTLDRIDNDDPEYAPGKVRWATKKVQNNNKGDTSVFTLSANGMKFTASQLAEHFGLTTDAIRKRFERGWTHDEIILGKRQSTEPEPKPKKSGYIPEPVTKFPAGLYAGEQLANLNRCETRLRDPRAIRFHREAHAHQGYREEYGQEFIVMTYEETQSHPELASITPAQHERHFLKHWPAHRPHTVYESLTPAQREFVASVDPTWVAKEQARSDAKVAMADLL